MSVARVLAHESGSTTTTIADETPIAWASASGVHVEDEQGRRYIDLTAGSGVASVGHGHPAVVAAVQEQAGRLLHTGWQYPCAPRATMLERLAALIPWPMERIVLTVTGAEAVEAALKVAQLATGRRTVLSFEGGFHGKTAGALRLTAQRGLRRGLGHLPPDSLHLVFPREDADDEFERQLDLLRNGGFELEDVAAIIVEPIQGAGGMICPPPGFLLRLERLCRDHGVLLIADEIFTGLGRTGKLFGCEHEGVTPDLLVIGKALGGGLPVSAVAGSGTVMQALGSLRQTSTFTGHPLACAAAVAVLDVLERERLAENAGVQGRRLRERLEGLGADATVRGRGLMLGVELAPGHPADGALRARRFVAAAADNGLLLLRGGAHGNVLKLTPPLTLTSELVDEIADRFGACLELTAS